MEPFKLSEIKEPRFEVEVAPGDVRNFDPFELISSIGDTVGNLLNSPDAAKIKDGVDQVRKAFGFPTQAEVDASMAAEAQSPIPPGSPDAVPVLKTLTINQCLALMGGLMDFVTELDVVKKLRGLTQN